MSDDDRIEAIREDIDRTRQDMGETVDQLQERLAPERLQQETSAIVQDVADRVVSEVQSKTSELTEQISAQIHSAIHDTTVQRIDELFDGASTTVRSAGRTIWERVAQNPAPAALAAIGIGLVAAAGQRASGSTADQPSTNGGESAATSGIDHVLAGADSMMTQAKEAASHATQQAAGIAGQAKGRLHDSAQAVNTDQLRGMLNGQPLFAGLAALGVGVAIGLSLPGSEREQTFTQPLKAGAQQRLTDMGMPDNAQDLIASAKEQAESLAARAKQSASAGLDELKHQAGDLAGSARAAAMDSARDQGLISEQ
jgi:F0F1-type ATP synthase membrane subunit b/b'